MSTLASQIARLQDPDRVAKSPRQLQELQEKISNCMTKLYRQPMNGGNPFLFALAGPKPHFLAREITGVPIMTAATDGKRYFWNPEFLESLDENAVSTVMSHESYHILFYHCDGSRSLGKQPRLWNLAVDYVVNSVIEHDHVKSGRNKKYQLWQGPLGNPVTLADYKKYLHGQIDLPQHGCFADSTLYSRSPESIYDELLQAEMTSPRRCKETQNGCGAMSIDPKTGKSVFENEKPKAGDPPPKDGEPWGPNSCPKCGAPPNYGPGGLDSHLPSGMSKEEVMGEMMRAAEQAENMRGTVPAEVEAALNELKKPTLRPRDIIKHAFQRKAIDVGSKNDWKRFNRRGLAMEPAVYIPKKHDHFPKWIVLLDTSGSMSDEDIANGLKEMQAVPNSEGYVVPCDAVPYWDQATKVRDTSDLKRTKVVGRGGTVFDQFFRELPQKMGRDFDIVVIISDGDCGHISAALRPPCDVLWVITNKREFHPSFGRVVQLNPARA